MAFCALVRIAFWKVVIYLGKKSESKFFSNHEKIAGQAAKDNDKLRQTVVEMDKQLDDLVYEWVDVSDEENEGESTESNQKFSVSKFLSSS